MRSDQKANLFVGDGDYFLSGQDSDPEDRWQDSVTATPAVNLLGGMIVKVTFGPEKAFQFCVHARRMNGLMNGSWKITQVDDVDREAGILVCRSNIGYNLSPPL